MKFYLPATRHATALSLPYAAPVARRAACSALWREQEAMMQHAFRQSSPRYELTNTAEKFQIAVDVPGVKASDISVNLENHGQILTLSGHREKLSPEGRYKFQSKFQQSFQLDEAVDTEKITANLSNGVLIVEAPKDVSKLEDKVTKIPITEHAHREEEPVTIEAAGEAQAKDATQAESAKKDEEVVVETVEDAEMNEADETTNDKTAA